MSDEKLSSGSDGPGTEDNGAKGHAVDAVEPTALPTGDDAKPKVLFGGKTASEAAKIRWDRDRARKAQEAEVDAQARSGEVLVVRTTVETGKVINRLALDAKNGNVQAARELRAYLAEVQVESDTDVSALDRKTRQSLMGRLLAEIQAEDNQGA